MKKLTLSCRAGEHNMADAKIITDFQIACAMESEKRRLDFPIVLDAVSRILRNSMVISPGIGQYLLVENEEAPGSKAIIACCLLQHQASEWTGGWYLNVESVYVHADYRGNGILQYMLQRIEEDARKMKHISEIRLSVAETNKPMHWALEKVNITKSKYVIFSKAL